MKNAESYQCPDAPFSLGVLYYSFIFVIKRGLEGFGEKVTN